MTNGQEPIVPPEAIIARTEFPKWWRNIDVTKIDLLGVGAQIIVPWLKGRPRYLLSLYFVVDGETDIFLRFGYSNITGPMRFGGPDQPRAIVLNFTSAPIPCGAEIMSLYQEPKTPDVQVSGTAVYYIDWSSPAQQGTE